MPPHTLDGVTTPPPLTLLPDRVGGLPRGRSALPSSEVAAAQRGRMLQAITDEVAERGYAATSVQDVIRRARVSRSVFYEQFDDKQDAFLEAHAVASRQLIGLIRHRVAELGDAPWRQRMRTATEAYLGGFESAPTYAVSFMVELRAAGPPLLDQRDRTLERHARDFAELAKHAAAQDPSVHVPTDLEVIGAMGAADELTTRAIRAGHVADLGYLVEPITSILEALLLRGHHGPSK
jgi:AcrR family transcriptional regulator